MKKILIVSDNEFLNLLYVMNLEVYLAVNTTLVVSLAAAIETLKSKEKFDLILTLEIVNKESATKALETHLKSFAQKIPMIIAGAEKDDLISENVFGVIGKFNIQGILKTSAKILGITAKQMAELDVGAYYPISIAPLLGFSKAPCQIFTQNGSSYKSLVRSDDPLGDLLVELNKKGTQQVFVNSKDRLVITNKISLTIIEKITASLKNLENAPVEKKVQALSDGYEFAAANLFSSDEIKQQMQEIATASAKVMQDVAKDSSSVKSLLAVMMSNKDGYIFTHSMITSYVAYHMIKNVTWGGEGQVEKINFVLFFHDIFLAPIYLKHPELKIESTLLENANLDDKEKDIVLNHAKLAAELVVGYKRCPMGADILIKQHHGMKKGKGFVKFYMEDLSPLSKILLIAEMFVEELMKSHDEKIPFNAKLVIPKLISEFKSPSYTKMVQSLVNVPI
jgi:HD-GYP domain-containing protein (c-di-GMP phosphodiesterase class II)/CheY-like chemotaxis protein